MLWEFKQGNNALATVIKICSVYNEGVILLETSLKNFVLVIWLYDEGGTFLFDDDILKALLKQNLHLSTGDKAEKLKN